MFIVFFLEVLIFWVILVKVNNWLFFLLLVKCIVGKIFIKFLSICIMNLFSIRNYKFEVWKICIRNRILIKNELEKSLE